MIRTESWILRPFTTEMNDDDAAKEELIDLQNYWSDKRI